MVVIADVVLLFIINTKTPIEIDTFNEIFSIIFQLTFSTVWIIYFIKSTRVKRTFVFTYPESAWRWELIKGRANSINVPFPNRLDNNIEVIKHEEESSNEALNNDNEEQKLN